jgi:hypothetical protein
MLDDGSPNPKHDKQLYEHGMDLLFATVGLARNGASTTSSPGAT